MCVGRDAGTSGISLTSAVICTVWRRAGRTFVQRASWGRLLPRVFGLVPVDVGLVPQYGKKHRLEGERILRGHRQGRLCEPTGRGKWVFVQAAKRTEWYRHSATADASATSWGSGSAESRSSVWMACCICSLGARPLPVSRRLI